MKNCDNFDWLLKSRDNGPRESPCYIPHIPDIPHIPGIPHIPDIPEIFDLGNFSGGGFGAFSYWTLGFDLGIPEIFDLGI